MNLKTLEGVWDLNLWRRLWNFIVEIQSGPQLFNPRLEFHRGVQQRPIDSAPQSITSCPFLNTLPAKRFVKCGVRTHALLWEPGLKSGALDRSANLTLTVTPKNLQASSQIFFWASLDQIFWQGLSQRKFWSKVARKNLIQACKIYFCILARNFFLRP